MLNFPQPPKSYGHVYLGDTDKPLPQKIDQHMRYAMFSTIAKGGKGDLGLIVQRQTYELALLDHSDWFAFA